MGLEEIKDMLWNALTSDLEHGVAWMNEEASRRFAAEYPDLSKAINDIMNMEEDNGS